MHAVLRRALADAVRDELVSRSVSLLVSPGKAPRERVVPVTNTEARALLAAAADDRMCVLWLVLLSLRLRRGEALACAGAPSTSTAGRWSHERRDGPGAAQRQPELGACLHAGRAQPAFHIHDLRTRRRASCCFRAPTCAR